MHQVNYNQSQDIRWKSGDDITRAGVCFALSTQFIILTATGKDFMDFLTPTANKAAAATVVEEGGIAPKGSTSFAALASRMAEQHSIGRMIITRMAEQYRRVRSAGAGGAKAKYDYAVELVESNTPLKAKKDEDDLNFSPLPMSRRGEATTLWAEELDADKGLKYISFSAMVGSKSVSHGIAAIVHGGQWGIFDPNFGIWACDNIEHFKVDIKDLFETKYKVKLGWAIDEAQFTTFA